MKRIISILLLCGCVPVFAASIANGGFEAGFTGWTRADQLGSEGTFTIQSGTSSPVNGFPVPAPPGGTNAAMTDAQGPGSHVLYQTFAVDVASPSTFLSFDLFIGNRATAFSSPNSLDFATPTLNQQVRVDLIASTADPFSVAAGDVLQNLFRTQAGDPLVSGYTHYSVDVTSVLNANVGGSITLRFAEVDNVDIFNLGVDNVSLGASAVPEPATGLLLCAGAALFASLRRKA